MRNFAKSILNYFAAFNETRFRFSRKLPYEWSDDPLTLDLSVFPTFQKKLLDSVAQGISFRIEIGRGEYSKHITDKNRLPMCGLRSCILRETFRKVNEILVLQPGADTTK